jgi:hypothetical protein
MIVGVVLNLIGLVNYINNKLINFSVDLNNKNRYINKMKNNKLKIKKDSKGYIIKVNNLEVKSDVKLKDSKEKVYIISFRESEDNNIIVDYYYNKNILSVDFSKIEEIK